MLDIETCLLNLKKSNPDLTFEEGHQFCSMACAENQDAEICSKLIESDNQVI